MRIASVGARQIGEELVAKGALDVVEHLLLYRLHAQHPHDDLHGEAFGKLREDARGVFRLDLREDDGDSLRVFVLEVVGEHHLVDVAELVPHRAAGRTADLLHDVVDAVLAEDLGEEPLVLS